MATTVAASHTDTTASGTVNTLGTVGTKVTTTTPSRRTSGASMPATRAAPSSGTDWITALRRAAASSSRRVAVQPYRSSVGVERREVAGVGPRSEQPLAHRPSREDVRTVTAHNERSGVRLVLQ
jgi:hypothetical protein